jgi:hypothetical protein
MNSMNFRPFAADGKGDLNITVIRTYLLQFKLYPGKAEVAGISIFSGCLEAGSGEKVSADFDRCDCLRGCLCV